MLKFPETVLKLNNNLECLGFSTTTKKKKNKEMNKKIKGCL